GGRGGRSRERAGITERIGDERVGHGALHGGPKVTFSRARDRREDLLRRFHAESGLEQNTLCLGRIRARRPAHHLHESAPETHASRFPFPASRPCHGSPWRRRHAHSPAKAAIAATNSHQRSRSATPASLPPVAPGCGATTTGAGRHSSE